MPAPSFTGALALILCSARLTFDLVTVYYKLDRVEPTLWSAYRFAEVLNSVRDESTCLAMPSSAGVERAPEKDTSPDSVVIFLSCAVGLLSGSGICLCICLRRRRRCEVRPYTPLVSGSNVVDARRARIVADEGW